MTRLGICLVVVSLALVSPSGNAAGQHAARHRLIGTGELIAPNGQGRWQGFTSELSPEQRAVLSSDITAAEYARVHVALNTYERTYGLPPATKTDISTRYPFYPQAGVHEGDLFFSGLDGNQVGDDLDGLGFRAVGVGPAGDLVEVVADARDLPVALALHRGRRGGPCPRALSSPGAGCCPAWGRPPHQARPAIRERRW